MVFESKVPFSVSEADDWWLCFDALEVADRELRTSDAILSDRKRRPFTARRVVGAGVPDILVQYVRVEGWRPVNTLPKISDPSGIIERLGGKQLYGNNPTVPIRELIQNSADAIRARRFLDAHFFPTESRKYPGQILVEFKQIPDTRDFWVTVEDNGIGMSERTITRSLLDFGTSFWSSNAAAELYPGLPSEKKFRPTGKYGIGFFSVFMYSDAVVVMSREFRGSSNSWNKLSFAHGIRGRANFSIEGLPTEVKAPDASTRVKFRVDEEYLRLLATADTFVNRTMNLSSSEEKIVQALKNLVCALDVSVQLSFLDGDRIDLNCPMIYESNSAAICEALRLSDDSSSPGQRQLLWPMGNREDGLYGYCAVSIDRHPSALIKSVGGLGSREYYGPEEELVGIVEYKATTANRISNVLAAPKAVVDAWAKKQIELILCLPLSDWEREAAAEHLSVLVEDIRPIFFISTSEGSLDLEGVISELQTQRSAIVSIHGYESSSNKVEQFYPSLPNLHHEIYFRIEDISFEEFAICPKWGSFSAQVDIEGKASIVTPPEPFKSNFHIIFNRLSELGIRFELRVLENFKIGTYAGLDSPRHGLKSGDELRSSVLRIVLQNGATATMSPR